MTGEDYIRIEESSGGGVKVKWGKDDVKYVSYSYFWH